MKNLYLTTAIALISSPALADITPEELWQSWQDTVASFGMTLSAGQKVREGNVLVLQDVTADFDFGFITMEQIIKTMRLEALPNGSVSVSYDSDYTGSTHFSIAGGFTNDITFTGQFERSQGLVIGTVEDYTYNFSIGLMHQVGKANMLIDDRANTRMSVVTDMNDISGQMHMVQASAGLNLTYTFSMGEFSNTQNALSPGGNGREEMKQVQRMRSPGFSGEVEAFIPQVDAPSDLRIKAVLALRSSSMSQQVTSPRINMDMEIEGGPGTFTFLIDDQNYGLTIDRQDAGFSLTSSQFGPLPFSAQIESSHLAVTLPYQPSDTPQDASFALGLSGVTVSDSIWALFDPQNTLSRAPADFAIDASASIGLLLDWTNIEAAKAWQGPPATLHQVTLQDFLVGFENARVTGQGAVDFSNEGSEPMPNAGALNFTLEGVPALLEKLGGLPMVDAQIIAGAQGMLGMFTSAGAGDTLTSTIEFGEGGAVTVNGQRVN